MSVFDQLHAGDYDGIPFLTRSEHLRTGRKRVIHEYVGGGRFVEDVGDLPPIFKVDMVVTGNDAIAKRNALVNRLNRVEGGVITLPHFGPNKVTHGSGVDVNTTDDAIGEIRITATFYRDSGAVFPEKAPPNSATVGALASDLRADLGTAFEKAYTIPKTKSSITSATDKILAISEKLAEVMDVSSSSPDALKKVNLAITTLRDSAQALTALPAELAAAVNDVFNNAAGLKVSLDNLRDLAGFGSSGTPVSQITPDRVARQGNTNALDQLTQINGVASAFEQASSTDWASTNELEGSRSGLDESFDTLFENALGTDSTGANVSLLVSQTGLLDPTQRQDPDALSLQADLAAQNLIIDTFNDIRTQTFRILDDAAQDVSTIVVASVPLTSAPVLVYQLYGSLDRLQEFSNANSAGVNLSHFEGDVLVFNDD